MQLIVYQLLKTKYLCMRNKMNKIFLFIPLLLLSCAGYTTPERDQWGFYLQGASFTDMTEMGRISKRPVYLGAGGKIVTDTDAAAIKEYGNKIENDNAFILNYMGQLEFELYDALRKPGISVQRAGSDVVVILVRDALMKLNAPDISETGADTLYRISKVLTKYNATFIEIAGYTDEMSDQTAAKSFSLDMAERAAIFLIKKKIIPARLFIIGRGSARPIAAQDDIGRLTNRRVEIRISPAR